jgi:hypothetical protein
MRDPSSIPDLTLERYRLDELPADQIAAIRERAALDPILRRRLAALAESDAAIQHGRDGDWLARAVADRLTRADRRINREASPRLAWGRMGWLAMASAVVVVGSAAIWSASGLWRPRAAASTAVAGGPASGPDRIKGEAAVLLVYRRTGASSERLSDGDSARPGDLVRIAYRASSAGFGVIVSIDGRGVVTRHLPVEGDAAVALQVGEPTPLADAYELDDAPRWEQFFLVTSDRVFDVARVVEAARRTPPASGAGPPAALPLPDGFDQSSFLLRKTS